MFYTESTDKYNRHSEVQFSYDNHQFKSSSVFHIHLKVDVPPPVGTGVQQVPS